MNSKTKTTVILLCSLIFILLFLNIWKVLELDKSRKMTSTLENQLMVFEYNNIENIKLYSQVYSNYFNNIVSIQETIGNKTAVLIYRYHKYMCESCLLEDMQEIEQLQQEIGKDKILLLPVYPDNRQGMIELSNVLAKFNYVNIQLESFLMPVNEDGILQRYFAVIDREWNLTMVFFPHRGEADKTRLYFSEVKKVLLENQ